MQLPFTVEQFLSVFERYNRAIGPAPILAYALAALALAAAGYAAVAYPVLGAALGHG